MIFTQDESLLLSKGQAAAELAHKEDATILLLSDSHGASGTLQHILREQGEPIARKRPDALIFCGDGIWDICDLILQAEGNEGFAALLPPVIGIVQGNMDTGEYRLSDPALGNEPLIIRVPLTQTLTACGNKVFFTHGHRFSLYNGIFSLVQRAREEGANLAVYGHTHIARAENTLAMLAVNPGSCSVPRGGMPQSYALLEMRKNSSIFDIRFYQITGRTSKPFLPKRSPFF